jgi:hypothetical protein
MSGYFCGDYLTGLQHARVLKAWEGDFRIASGEIPRTKDLKPWYDCSTQSLNNVITVCSPYPRTNRSHRFDSWEAAA